MSDTKYLETHEWYIVSENTFTVGISDFAQGELVACFSPEGREIARGLTNYSSKELDQIKGCRTQDIEGVLGYLVADEVIHRDDLLPL